MSELDFELQRARSVKHALIATIRGGLKSTAAWLGVNGAKIDSPIYGASTVSFEWNERLGVEGNTLNLGDHLTKTGDRWSLKLRDSLFSKALTTTDIENFSKAVDYSWDSTHFYGNDNLIEQRWFPNAVEKLTGRKPPVTSDPHEKMDAVSCGAFKALYDFGLEDVKVVDNAYPLTGALVYIGHKPNIEFTWRKSVNNMLFAAFGRQLATKLTPDEQCVHDFANYAKPVISQLVGELDLCLSSPDEWLSSRVDWDQPKRKLYGDNIRACLDNPSAVDWEASEYEAIVKDKEVGYTTDPEVDKYGRWRVSTRPRLIFNPLGMLKGPLAWFQSCLFKELKRVLPSFIHSYTTEEFQEHILANIHTSWGSMDFDGSNFDGHQHHTLLRAVDGCLWTKLRSKIRSLVEPFTSEPDILTNGLITQATKPTGKMWFKHKGEGSTRLRLGYISIRGTTFSGHPSRTTLGNTLRQILYIKFVAASIGINLDGLSVNKKADGFVAVAGDDAVVWAPRGVLDRLLVAFKAFFANDTSERSYGLGQCIKEYHVSDWWDFSFCSRLSYLSSNGVWVMMRNPLKTLLAGNYYYGKASSFADSMIEHGTFVSSAWAEDFGWTAAQMYAAARTKKVSIDDGRLAELKAKRDYYSFSQEGATNHKIDEEAMLRHFSARLSIPNRWLSIDIANLSRGVLVLSSPSL